MKKDVVVVLDNIRSAHNVGSIFRTCDGAGVDKLYLVGTTPTPIDRFGRPQLEIQKTSLGASETVSWEQIGTAESLSTEAVLALIEELKQDDYKIVAVEQTKESISIKDFKVSERTCFIFGTERGGVQPELLEQADLHTEIPMYGTKDSLNVSVAVGVVLFNT